MHRRQRDEREEGHAEGLGPPLLEHEEHPRSEEEQRRGHQGQSSRGEAGEGGRGDGARGELGHPEVTGDEPAGEGEQEREREIGEPDEDSLRVGDARPVELHVPVDVGEGERVRIVPVRECSARFLLEDEDVDVRWVRGADHPPAGNREEQHQRRTLEGADGGAAGERCTGDDGGRPEDGEEVPEAGDGPGVVPRRAGHQLRELQCEPDAQDDDRQLVAGRFHGLPPGREGGQRDGEQGGEEVRPGVRVAVAVVDLQCLAEEHRGHRKQERPRGVAGDHEGGGGDLLGRRRRHRCFFREPVRVPRPRRAAAAGFGRWSFAGAADWRLSAST